MKDLEIIKEVAKIERPDSHVVYDDRVTVTGVVFGKEYEEYYNPIRDLTLRDKYEVIVDYHNKIVLIYKNAPINTTDFVSVSFKSKEEINRAVCLCIIEAYK